VPSSLSPSLAAQIRPLLPVLLLVLLHLSSNRN
jgi:hypothetical protein